MPTLSERLSDLAEDAPDSPTPEGVWVEGRRRARARRAGTAVVVAATLVLLVAVGGFTLHRNADPGYAATPGAPPALPTRIYHPSPWLSGTGDRPPGQLSMLIPGKRGGWPHYHWGMVGVSASTGAYHYLDIPGCFSVDGLAPDGRHVSCFVSVDSGGRQVVRGVAIYDTVTGHVDRWMSGSGRLALNSLTWNGNDAIAFRAGDTSYVWRFGHGAPRSISTRLTSRSGTAGSSGLYASSKHGYFYLEPGHPDHRVRVVLENAGRTRTSTAASLSPSGRRIALVHATDTSSTLLLGDVAPAGRRTRTTPVEASLQWPRIVGWADERHLLVVNLVSPTGAHAQSDPNARYALDRVDVDTGQVTQVAAMSDEQTSLGAIFASSLLGAPTRDFPAPPSPMNQRLEAGLVLGVLLVGGVALVVWRRRARP
jgi:hypothetical protein